MIGWLDCSSGVSGDMLLGSLVDVGVDVALMQAAVDAVTPEPVQLRVSRVMRSGVSAMKVDVEGTSSSVHRTFADIRSMLGSAPAQALSVFSALANAEARVHGTTPDEVHFHEVGALDAIADVVGVCAGLESLGLSSLVVSPVALGGGSVQAAHGRLPVPGPAVVELLRGAPTYGGPVDVELATPTGAALIASHASSWGHQPPMTAQRQGFGAGGRDLPGHPNVVRLLLGDPVPRDLALRDSEESEAVLLETNVDDLDPRLWPSVLAELLRSGASDAWLTPILMKKGRPAHTLHVLVAADSANDVERVVFAQTPAIGLRRVVVGKRALERRSVTVDVAGQPVSVKVAMLDGEVVNRQPEYEDVVRAATTLGRPVKVVMADAVAAAANLVVP